MSVAKVKKGIAILISLLLTFGIIFNTAPLSVFADGSAVDAKVTELKILTDSGSPATEIDKSATIRLKFNYETLGTKILQSGDYFDITIPKEVDLSQATTNPLSFDLTDENGDIIAKATITPNSATATTGGGNVRITFTDKAKGKYKVKGNIFFDAKLNKKVVQENKITNIKTEVNGDGKNTPDSIPIKVKPDGALSDKEIIGKWGKSPTVPNVAAWGVRINRTNQNLKKVVITDKITSNNGHFLEPSSYPAVKTTEQFKLMKTTYDSSGNVQDWNGEVVDISDKITFNADHTEFRLELGDIGTQSYFLSYKSTVENGDIVQTNGATITSDTFPTQKSDGVWKYRTAGGGAIGVLAKRLKIRKVDVDTNVGLAGAKFKVTKVDGTSFELTTGADGTIISQQLVQGKYKVKELVAPNGYEIDPNEYTVNVYDDVGGTITVKDKLNKVSVSVTKKWVGKGGTAAKIHLYAGDTEVDSVTLNTGNNWKHTFAGLEKYKDGKEIKYTIKEDAIANYKTDISGDAASGFTVKNTNTEKVTVPVEKKWVGKSTNKVEVKLLADGTEKESADLTAADSWKHEFKNLPKYDSADGHEIVYTIKEVKISGYNTVISGTAKDGFTITNTITGKVSIPVTKKWVGKEGIAAKIHLYAGDTEVDSVTLNTANNWQHTFAGLEKYKDGKEIKYTIKEDAIANYKTDISGDAASGFTVKNTNTEKVTVPVEKKWVGKSTNKVEVKLLADGTEKESADLTAADSWKHEFKNLPKYDSADGHEIVYTIKEVKISGYNTVISGTAKDGFTITNTIIGKVSVPVTKKWVGTPADSITVNLYANGNKVDSKKITKNDNWRYIFKDLEKYKDGKEIKYTIDEEKVAGYTTSIAGDSQVGYTITNTKNTPNIPNKPKKPKKPNTGDDSNFILYGEMLISSLLLIICLFVKGRKQS